MIFFIKKTHTILAGIFNCFGTKIRHTGLFYAGGVREMSTIGFLKGMAAGALVGSVAVMLFDPITPRQRRRAKRQIAGAMRNIGNMADDLMHMKC